MRVQPHSTLLRTRLGKIDPQHNPLQVPSLQQERNRQQVRSLPLEPNHPQETAMGTVTVTGMVTETETETETETDSIFEHNLTTN